MKAIQRTLGVAGLAAGLYGVLLLVERPEDLIPVSTWLIGGVIVHDAFLAPLVVALCFAGAWFLPRRFARPATIVLIIFGSASLIAIPVLGRFGAKADNPTLLDRDYFLGWLTLGALTLFGTLLAGAITSRRQALPIRAAELNEAKPEEA